MVNNRRTKYEYAQISPYNEDQAVRVRHRCKCRAFLNGYRGRSTNKRLPVREISSTSEPSKNGPIALEVNVSSIQDTLSYKELISDDISVGIRSLHG